PRIARPARRGALAFHPGLPPHGGSREASPAPRKPGPARGQGGQHPARPRPRRGGRFVRIRLRAAHGDAVSRAACHRVHTRGDGRLALLHLWPLEHGRRGRSGRPVPPAHRGAPARPRAARPTVSFPVRLVLFDVDGTILSARGAGRRAFAAALMEVYGTAGDIERYDLRGATDQRIVFELMEGAGLSRDGVRERLDDCFEAYARGLHAEIGDGRGVVVMPGIADLVQRLDGEKAALVGLLTGKIGAVARIKLTPSGLWPYFQLGAYGSDHHDRRQLPPLAARRAQALVGRGFRPEEILVIGDTPRDIECARHFGAVAVAVAAGRYSRAEREAEGPDLLFDDFSDAEAALTKFLSR